LLKTKEQLRRGLRKWDTNRETAKRRRADFTEVGLETEAGARTRM